MAHIIYEAGLGIEKLEPTVSELNEGKVVRINGDNINNLYDIRTGLKIRYSASRSLFSYNFEGLSKSASYKSPLIQEVSELSSEANGTYSGEFGNVISFQDMDGNDFRGLVWSARSIFHTDNTYVAFSVSPKAGEIIRVDSVSLSLGVRSFIPAEHCSH